MTSSYREVLDHDDDDVAIVKPSKKAKTNGSEPKLDALAKESTVEAGGSKPSKVKSMQPRTPPKPKKPLVKSKPTRLDVDDSDDMAGSPAEVVTKKRSPRRVARAPAKYIEVSSEGDWNAGDDGDSFAED